MHTCLSAAVTTADIIFIQEPWIHSSTNTTITHPSFQPIIPNIQGNRRPRTLTFISTANPHLKVTSRPDISSDPDCQVIEVGTALIPTITFFNIYNERKTGGPRAGAYTIDRLFPTVTFPPRCIITGDMNAHHEWWNSDIHTPRRADTLVSVLERERFHLVNEPDEPTYNFRNGKGRSIIDLTFASPTVSDSVVDWAIDEDQATGSDHELIRYNVLSDNVEIVPDPRTGKYNWKKAEWDKFGKELQAAECALLQLWEESDEDLTEARLEAMATDLRDTIAEAVNNSVPLIRVSPRSKTWWTPEVKEKRTVMAARLRRWREYLNPATFLDFKRTRNDYFKSIRKAKEESWTNFLNEAKGADIFKALRYCRPRKVQRTPVLEHQDRTATTFAEKAQMMREVLFPPLPNAPPVPLEEIVFQRQPILWEPATEKEVRNAIFTSSPSKAPGPDGISFLCLQHAYTAAPKLFNTLYTKLADAGYHPKCWREATGAIIPKVNKPDYGIPKAYRIVALLNCLGKILEKMMATRLSYLAETEDILHPEQIGGRKQRSAVDAVMALVHDIEMGKSNKWVTSVLMLDVKGAFDNVSRARLLKTMRELGLPDQYLSWTEDFMTDRRAALAFDGEKESIKPVETGIPQGSPISPILFLIYIRPLFDRIQSKFPAVGMPSYIDDVGIVYTGKSLKTNSRVLQEVAREVFQWAEENAVTFDDSKSELIHFTQQQRKPTNTVQLPNGTVVQPSECLRWLGVWLDRKLSFHTHVQHKATAARRALGALQGLANSENGLRQSAVRQLYISTVCAVADFGSEVWWRGQKGYARKLQLVQNTALRKIAGAFRTTPVAALEAEQEVPPVVSRLNLQQKKYALRVMMMKDTHPIRTRCPDTFPPSATSQREESDYYCPWNRLENRSAPYETQLDRVLSRVNTLVLERENVETVDITHPAPWETVNIHTEILKKSKDEAAELHESISSRLKSSSRNLIFYTDGSKLKENVGAAFVCSDGNFNSYVLGEETEVFDGEFYAIHQAAQHALIATRNSRYKKVVIFSDNQACVKRLSNPAASPGQQWCIRIAAVSRELERRSILLSIQWVPGHSGVEENERVDQLAKEAAGKPSLRPLFTSLSFLKRKVKETQALEWAELWRTSCHGKSYRGSPTTSLRKIIATFDRAVASTITQLRTGHGHFNTYLVRIPSSGVVSQRCGCGASHQSPEHLLMRCKIFARERKTMKKEIRKLPFMLHILLYTKPGLAAISKFLLETKIATREWRLGTGTDHEESWSTSIGWGRIPTGATSEEEEQSEGDDSGEETG
jgi:ribonuclease HI